MQCKMFPFRLLPQQPIAAVTTEQTCGGQGRRVKKSNRMQNRNFDCSNMLHQQVINQPNAYKQPHFTTTTTCQQMHSANSRCTAKSSHFHTYVMPRWNQLDADLTITAFFCFYVCVCAQRMKQLNAKRAECESAKVKQKNVVVDGSRCSNGDGFDVV